MDTIIVELTAAFVDNWTTLSNHTKVETTLENSSGRIVVEDCAGTPRSIHRLTIADANDVGCGNTYKLTTEQGGLILAICCSLSNTRIIFAPLQPHHLPTSLKRAAIPPQVKIVETTTGNEVSIKATVRMSGSLSTILSAKLALDEDKILNIAGRLLAYRPFDTANRNLPDSKVLESIKMYRHALLSTEALSCYKFLYISLEKAVNFDRDHTRSDFDKAASELIGLPQARIKELRQFDNRIKHALRSKTDIATLKEKESQLAPLVRDLKKATDDAILSKI